MILLETLGIICSDISALFSCSAVPREFRQLKRPQLHELCRNFANGSVPGKIRKRASCLSWQDSPCAMMKITATAAIRMPCRVDTSEEAVTVVTDPVPEMVTLVVIVLTEAAGTFCRVKATMSPGTPCPTRRCRR